MQTIEEEIPLAADMPTTATMNRMTRLLKTVRPTSNADALRMLRAAFPESSLTERIAALARHSGEVPILLS
jgi:hypothetical protein